MIDDIFRQVVKDGQEFFLGWLKAALFPLL
jgi:hypothetical protein